MDLQRCCELYLIEIVSLKQQLILTRPKVYKVPIVQKSVPIIQKYISGGYEL